MRKGIRVLIVDDQPRARQSLRALLATMPGIGDVWEAEGGAQAVECVRDLEPDVVVLDIVMPGIDGVQVTRTIKSEKPATRIVVLTLYPDYREEALAAGADCFLTKGGPSRELFDAVLGQAHVSENGENHS